MKSVEPLVQIVAGLALNAFPAIFIAVFARVAPIEQQGRLAVSLAIGTYVAQLLSAFVVESRLATPEADHKISMPWWIALLSTVSGTLLIVSPTVPPTPVTLIGVLGLSSGLLMARTIGVVRGRWKLESVAASILMVGCLSALVLAVHDNANCVRVLATGALLAILIRCWPLPARRDLGFPPDLTKAAWVTGETATVGMVQPALSTFILAVLGPSAAVGFRVVSTISGILEPILAYGRVRQLAHGHKGEVAQVAMLLVAGTTAIFVGAYLGMWSLIFGPAWNSSLYVALAIACVWKLCLLVTTIPFAALRRAGRTKTVFWLRAVNTALYVVLGLTFLFGFNSSAAVFLSFVITEVLMFVPYHLAASRSAPEYNALLVSRKRAPRFASEKA
ncbi:hypothetical protein [Rhodococcus sp. IEGM 1379]|uniref:hypothetical protein n=1 Tax=Rhodococcus sp. IEGM 1379 TaxID=3047086 RepID=UPI0024B7607C|nr:hypothetical protein [Rhodococcus sp. IEGM 1379]MDI9916916.1 hypothetical protein [Rhodococcus sp. IEGM 1379]